MDTANSTYVKADMACLARQIRLLAHTWLS